MFSCTHCKAKRWSRKPEFLSPAGISGLLEKPNTVPQSVDTIEQAEVALPQLTIGSVICCYYHHILVHSKGATIVASIRNRAKYEIALRWSALCATLET